jgi:hypothetical protein
MTDRRFGREATPPPPSRGETAAAGEAPPREPARDREYEGDGRRFARRDRELVHERRHDEFGGINWGSAFFGWLVAVGLAALLTSFLTAAGAATGLTDESAETVGIVGGALLIAVLAIAYLCGGYVAGRMSRFDGARQGLTVWVFGLVVTLVLAVLGALAGSEWNLLGKLDLPRVPIDEGDLATGGVIALGAILFATLLSAVIGGKAGESYHRRVDRFGYAD